MKPKILFALVILSVSLSTLVFATLKGRSNYVFLERNRSFAQASRDSVYYSCPMHPEMQRSTPGNCPRCKMVMEKHILRITGTKIEIVPTAAMDKVYTCPNHPEVRAGAPGKCPKCGMDLVEKKDPVH